MRGSLTPAFASARPVCLAVKLAYRVCTTRPDFQSGISQPLYASVTFLEATSPVKLPTRQCPPPRFLCRRKSDFLISKSGIPLLTEVSHLCSTVKIKSSVSRCSKAPRGLFVQVQVGRIFTAISISPGNGSRQSLRRSTFRAGRNLPDTNMLLPPNAGCFVSSYQKLLVSLLSSDYIFTRTNFFEICAGFGV